MDIISPTASEIAELRPLGAPKTEDFADMSTLESDGVALEAPELETLLPAEPAVATAIRVHGKFFFAGEEKHFVKGVTYGPFAEGSHGAQFPERDVVEHDFALMASAGVNTLRVFTAPPVWLLDMADAAGLKVLVGLPWTQHVAFLDSAAMKSQIRRHHRRGAGMRSPSGCFCLFGGQ
jgi:hypothetical protein